MGTPFGREGSEGKVLRIDRPWAGGFNVPPLAGGKVVHSTKGGRLWWRLCRSFYRLLRSGGGRPEIWKGASPPPTKGGIYIHCPQGNP